MMLKFEITLFNKMRDTKRIKPFLEKIEKIWLENPDYRSGQLIMAITRTNEHSPKLFNIEEEEFVKKLEELKELINKNNKLSKTC